LDLLEQAITPLGERRKFAGRAVRTASVKVCEIDYGPAPRAPNAGANERGASKPRAQEIRAFRLRIDEFVDSRGLGENQMAFCV